MTTLSREAVTEHLLAWWHQASADQTVASPREHCEAMADVVMALARPESDVKLEALAEAERRMFGTTDGDLLADDSDAPVGELRRLLWVGVDPDAGVAS